MKMQALSVRRRPAAHRPPGKNISEAAPPDAQEHIAPARIRDAGHARWMEAAPEVRGAR